MLTQQLQLLRLNRKCATCNACPGRDSCVGIKLKACSRCHTAWYLLARVSAAGMANAQARVRPRRREEGFRLAEPFQSKVSCAA